MRNLDWNLAKSAHLFSKSDHAQQWITALFVAKVKKEIQLCVAIQIEKCHNNSETISCLLITKIGDTYETVWLTT